MQNSINFTGAAETVLSRGAPNGKEVAWQQRPRESVLGFILKLPFRSAMNIVAIIFLLMWNV